jgi:hypothetical protein
LQTKERRRQQQERGSSLLVKLNFGSTAFINLAKGLITDSFAKVHFNGLFTSKFPLQRGVKQGCPLAPLLFALSTQPLMAILSAHRQSGAVRGIDIGDQQQILFQFFADDTGLFFEATEDNYRAVMEWISIFERISGAKVNLDKSNLVQLDSGPQLEWFQRAGCQITGDGVVMKNLGCSFGRKITAQQEIDFVLDKLRKRLRLWSLRMLSLPGKVIALKHLLRAMPIFHLMILDFNQKGYTQLETVCRIFLWGTSATGKPEVPHCLAEGGQTQTA